jgi:hypothetical protein
MTRLPILNSGTLEKVLFGLGFDARNAPRCT